MVVGKQGGSDGAEVLSVSRAHSHGRTPDKQPPASKHPAPSIDFRHVGGRSHLAAWFEVLSYDRSSDSFKLKFSWCHCYLGNILHTMEAERHPTGNICTSQIEYQKMFHESALFK